MSKINNKYLRAILKIIILIAIIFFVLYASFLYLRFGMTGTLFPAPTLRQTERFFESNREDFLIVAQYLSNTNYTSIGITDSSPSIMENASGHVQFSARGETERIIVSDENVSEAIRLILNSGYRIISRYSYGVVFTRWFMMDNSRGIVYSIDGRIPDSDTILFLTELHPLSEENWFFFIENFSEYRRGIRPNSVEE